MHPCERVQNVSACMQNAMQVVNPQRKYTPHQPGSHRSKTMILLTVRAEFGTLRNGQTLGSRIDALTGQANIPVDHCDTKPVLDNNQRCLVNLIGGSCILNLYSKL